MHTGDRGHAMAPDGLRDEGASRARHEALDSACRVVLEQLRHAESPRPVVAVVGGAVAGSEAAAALAQRGAVVVVFEQGARPYGKVEDGLPKWHVKLREHEYERIHLNLSTPNVALVPNTEIGKDISFDELRTIGFSSIVLANGAWRDRPLPVQGIDSYVGRGLTYQNTLVQAFNSTPTSVSFEVVDRAIIVGGGLASIDVAKLISLELYAAALRARGIEVDLVEMELKGIDKTLQEHGLAPEQLQLHGVTLFYRRGKEDMPLASLEGATPEQEQKVRAARAKIMDRVIRKYFVHFEPFWAPVAPIAEAGRLAGLEFGRVCVKDGRAIVVEASEPNGRWRVRSPWTVSSIGSVPMELAGVPQVGELYDFIDKGSGLVRGTRNVFGVGNVRTGKGNIKDSRDDAVNMIDRVVSHHLTPADTTTQHHIAELVARQLARAD